MTKNLLNSALLKQLGFYCVLLLAWHIISKARVWPDYLFPSLGTVFSTLESGFRDHTFLIGILTSLKRLFLGFAFSVTLGGVLGVALVKFKLLEETLGGLILGLQTMPSICWFPLALLWFGLGENAIIFVVIMGSLFSITMAVHSAIKSIPPMIIGAGKNMGARRITLLLWVMLPAAVPSLLIGARQSWSFAWRSLMAGELLFNSQGLGFLLNIGRDLNDMSQVIAVMLIITLISVLIDKLFFGKLESSVKRRWGLKRKF